MTDEHASTQNPETGGIHWSHVIAIVLVTIALTIGVTYWALKTYVFIKEFEPVTLNLEEEQLLDAKLEAIGYESEEFDAEGNLKPQAYSEAGASREVSFNERELNGLLAKNTDLAKKVAIDLSDDLISARILIPMAEDFPVLGGQTLRVNAGLEVAYLNNRPKVILKGVSIMGVPVPSAWLGGIKNIDLVNEYGTEDGFWKAFADGVRDIYVQEGEIRVQLKE